MRNVSQIDVDSYLCGLSFVVYEWHALHRNLPESDCSNGYETKQKIDILSRFYDHALGSSQSILDEILRSGLGDYETFNTFSRRFSRTAVLIVYPAVICSIRSKQIGKQILGNFDSHLVPASVYLMHLRFTPLLRSVFLKFCSWITPTLTPDEQWLYLSLLLPLPIFSIKILLPNEFLNLCTTMPWRRSCKSATIGIFHRSIISPLSTLMLRYLATIVKMTFINITIVLTRMYVNRMVRQAY